MKLLISILLTLSIKICFGQPGYVRIIDSATKEIESRDDLYGFDSVYTEVDKDSNITKQICLSFRYSDIKWRTLVMVKEIKLEDDDSSMLHYFFKKNQLLKIYANIQSGNITTTQQFYFNRGRLVFPNYYRAVFEVNNYLKKSKEYVTLKRKIK